ncbi:MAG: polyprenyl synthetase family protein [Planctomycetales bacterium]
MTPDRWQAFLEFAESARPRIDDALRRFTPAGEGCPDQLSKAIAYALTSGGKRLRPLLVLMAADACGGQESSALPAACAVEMIHAYSLIHDDLPAMDDDDMRRGKPSCHKAFGEAMAILAGDALLTRAFEILASETRPPELAAECVTILAGAAGASGMVGGQVDDVFRQPSEDATQRLEYIHERKTGAMLSASLKLGGIVAGGNSQQLDALRNYGRRLGLAFQIVDDLLDVQGDENVVGKRLGKDSRDGKLTFPGLLGIEASRRKAQELIVQACDALAPLRSRSHCLEALAHFVLERDR